MFGNPRFAPLYQRQYKTFTDLIEEVMNKFLTYRIALFSTIACFYGKDEIRFESINIPGVFKTWEVELRSLFGSFFMRILNLLDMFLSLMEFVGAHCLSSITKVILMQPSLMIQVVLGSKWFFAITWTKLLLH